MVRGIPDDRSDDGWVGELPEAGAVTVADQRHNQGEKSKSGRTANGAKSY